MLVRHEPTSASLVRHRLSDDLARHNVAAEVAAEVVIVASELVGNAIRHAPAARGGGLLVAWQFDADGVVVRVTDSGEARPTARVASEHEPSGRGLRIVQALSDRWGVEPIADGSGGKCVWAHIRLHPVLA
jgi:anti-sigma regulatory factor (Ser/Thr protein kinase)